VAAELIPSDCIMEVYTRNHPTTHQGPVQIFDLRLLLFIELVYHIWLRQGKVCPGNCLTGMTCRLSNDHLSYTVLALSLLPYSCLIRSEQAGGMPCELEYHSPMVAGMCQSLYLNCILSSVGLDMVVLMHFITAFFSGINFNKGLVFRIVFVCFCQKPFDINGSTRS